MALRVPKKLTGDADIQTKFAPIFALKSAVNMPMPSSKRLKADQQKKAGEALNDAVSAILAHCSGISTHPDNETYSKAVVLWDFMNGREIHLIVNERGGYDLAISAPKISWTETQLTLDLLLLKLLALDYTPAEFRTIGG